MTNYEYNLIATREGLARILKTESGRKMFENYAITLDQYLMAKDQIKITYTGRLNRRYFNAETLASNMRGELCGIISALAVSLELMGYEVRENHIRAILNEQAYEYDEEMKYFDKDCYDRFTTTAYQRKPEGVSRHD